MKQEMQGVGEWEDVRGTRGKIRGNAGYRIDSNTVPDNDRRYR